MKAGNCAKQGDTFAFVSVTRGSTPRRSAKEVRIGKVKEHRECDSEGRCRKAGELIGTVSPELDDRVAFAPPLR